MSTWPTWFLFTYSASRKRRHRTLRLSVACLVSVWLMVTQFRNFTDITVSRGIRCHNGVACVPTHGQQRIYRGPPAPCRGSNITPLLTRLDRKELDPWYVPPRGCCSGRESGKTATVPGQIAIATLLVIRVVSEGWTSSLSYSYVCQKWTNHIRIVFGMLLLQLSLGFSFSSSNVN